MSYRYYPGAVKASVHLPYRVQVLPTGDAYALLPDGTLRRLQTLKLHVGVAIIGLNREQILFTRRDGSLLVGDEIRPSNVFR